MPFGSEGLQDGIGLALSGGGFRATLFHIGSLLRLNELGVLDKVSRISSVSGGSITAGVLAKEWMRLGLSNGPAPKEALIQYLVTPLREFCRRNIDVVAIGEGLLIPWKTVSEVVQGRYDEHLFRGMTLQQLPDAPRFVFNATNLQTGRSFRFSKPYMGDYLIGLIEKPDLPLSLAIAASSAFPPVLSPTILKGLPRFTKVKGAELFGDPKYTTAIHLSDGGVYDNLGLETVWNRLKTLLVSDAGAPFKVADTVAVDWLSQARTALDVATDQARALRKRALISDLDAQERLGAYWGIDTKIGEYPPVDDRLPCRDAVVRPLAEIRTRLNAFSDEEQGQLINWGYALCDAAMRSRAANIGLRDCKPSWPCPQQAL
jgi:NTE family protein